MRVKAWQCFKKKNRFFIFHNCPPNRLRGSTHESFLVSMLHRASEKSYERNIADKLPIKGPASITVPMVLAGTNPIWLSVRNQDLERRVCG